MPSVQQVPQPANQSIMPPQVPANPQQEEFRKLIETESLNIIKNLAEKGETPPERIQGIAQYVLDQIQPTMSIEELYKSAVKLNNKYSELSPIVIKVMTEYENKYGKKVLDSVSQMIRNGKYDDAQDLVKKLLMFKMGT